MVTLAVRIDLLAYSLLLSVLLIIYVIRNYNLKLSSTRLFTYILITTAFITLLDGLAWAVDSRQFAGAFYLNYIFNTLITALQYFPGFFWMIYLDFKMTADYEGVRGRVKYYLLPEFLILFVVIYNLFNGYLFRITIDNVYERGPGMPAVAAVFVLQYIVVLISVLRNRRYVFGELVASIIAFFSFPVIGLALQMFYFGTTLIWPSFTLINLIAFILLEKDVMLRDPLTGIHTRGTFEQRVERLLRHHREFSLIMFDLDDFKQINDTFGHKAGDEALIEIVDIVNQNKRKHDMFCRYGGDEFMLLMEGGSGSLGSNLRERIRLALIERNSSNEQYEIKVSFGLVFVPRNESRNVHQIFEELDRNMYEEKNSH